MFLPGGMIGAYTAGFIADKLGRYIITACKRSCEKVMFSQVSVCPQGFGVGTSHASWDRSHSRVPLPPPSRHKTGGPTPPPPGYQTWGPTPHLPWPSKHQTWGPSPPPYWHVVVTAEKHTVDRRAVRILLECCLVAIVFNLWLVI